MSKHLVSACVLSVLVRGPESATQSEVFQRTQNTKRGDTGGDPVPEPSSMTAQQATVSPIHGNHRVASIRCKGRSEQVCVCAIVFVCVCKCVCMCVYVCAC